MRTYTIEDMHKLAKKRKGKCLSKTYFNVDTKLKWQCNKRHVWNTIPFLIINGSWCPKCAVNQSARKRSLSIEEMDKIARKKEGHCLSKKYINNNTKLKWKCKYGHIWYAIPSSIKLGCWCPECGKKILSEKKRKYNIQDMKNLARKNKGDCLSKTLISTHKKLKWQCSKGHIWEAVPISIMKGHWCNKCAVIKTSEGLRKGLDYFKKIAKDREGKCLSKKYINFDSKLKWKCHRGHIWEATGGSINSGHWCPYCRQGIGERVTRKYFELIFNKKFPKTRPSWLKYKKNSRLELDGYCKKLKLAFEYHGRQHYHKIPYFLSTQTFKERKKIDKLKKKLCTDYKINLIEIPYSVKFEDMGEYIVNECKKFKIKIPNININKLYKSFNIYKLDPLQKYINIAEHKLGKCLSPFYVNSGTHLEWQCKKGHKWSATPENIKSGRWCPYCAKSGPTSKYTIEDMHKLAKKRKGKCLSDTYKGSHIKLKWQCKRKHIWLSIPSSVRKGHWCRKCSIIERRINKGSRKSPYFLF